MATITIELSLTHLGYSLATSNAPSIDTQTEKQAKSFSNNLQDFLITAVSM